MASAADILFWTGLTVAEEDADRLTAAASAELAADGGAVLFGEQKTEALCCLIAAKLCARSGTGDKISESLGGYSYSRKAPSSTSVWMDRYRELLSSAADSASSGRLSERVDRRILELNRRYGNDRRF